MNELRLSVCFSIMFRVVWLVFVGLIVVCSPSVADRNTLRDDHWHCYTGRPLDPVLRQLCNIYEQQQKLLKLLPQLGKEILFAMINFMRANDDKMLTELHAQGEQCQQLLNQLRQDQLENQEFTMSFMNATADKLLEKMDNLDIDDCANQPCQNGGTCVDGLCSYQCTCAAGYTGTQCQTGVCSNILVQQHVDNSVFFDRTWSEYKAGFGNTGGNYWLGNEQLHTLTQDNKYKLRFELQSDASGMWYWAEYNTFTVGDESTQYTLTVAGFQGNVTDDAVTSGWYLNGMQFSTKDRDNDKWNSNCAQVIGGGFWYNNCGDCWVNGIGVQFRWDYLSSPNTDIYLRASRMWLVCR